MRKNNLYIFEFIMKIEWLLLSFCFSCQFNENKGNHTKKDSINQVDIKNCEDVFVEEDEQISSIFKHIMSINYQDITTSNTKISISSEPVRNTFDSTKTDSIIFVRIGDDFFKYYSRNGTKTLQEFILCSNNIRVLNEVEIGMDYESFISIFLKKYYKEKIKEGINCIHITTLSEYDHLYFFFKEDKLTLIWYYNNIESFR